jgi:hypothetical protein
MSHSISSEYELRQQALGRERQRRAGIATAYPSRLEPKTAERKGDKQDLGWWAWLVAAGAGSPVVLIFLLLVRGIARLVRRPLSLWQRAGLVFLLGFLALLLLVLLLAYGVAESWRT